MRREIGLFEKIWPLENLLQAYVKARKGKRDRRDVQEFEADLEENLYRIGERLRNGGGPLGHFTEFTIYDPKQRVISAPCFADRVLHHAIMNGCEAGFERWLVGQTFACRTGKGLRAAIAEARKWSACRAWYLQLDVRHYFETIPRNKLLQKLERIHGETEMLNLWYEVV